jgi:hypothetical protein
MFLEQDSVCGIGVRLRKKPVAIEALPRHPG